MEAHDLETREQLRSEVARLRASCERLVLAADADRRALERELHRGVQQQLVALAVALQLAGELVDVDPTEAKRHLREMDGDVQRALDDAARLAERIHPPLLEAGGLAAALRAAATSGGASASVVVSTTSAPPPELAETVYRCWLAAVEHPGSDGRATVTVSEEGGALLFEIATSGDPARWLDGLRDRVEALGGRLTRSAAGNENRVSGSLPLAR